MDADKGNVRTLYDQTCGTCGFLTDALDQLDEWKAANRLEHPTVIVPYGEEINNTTWAMGKAALLLRNISNDKTDIYDQTKDLSEHIVLGDTLNDDKFIDETFDYQISNPPYGKSFEKEYDDVVKEHNRYGYKGRFGAGVPSKKDGSMLFLQNAIAKMRPVEDGGGKAAIILSASPLFNGDPGSDSSNIRRWILQNDYLDCIIKMPSGLFFRTSINTYLFILTNKKQPSRKGYVQLIDASEHHTAMNKNKGKKNVEFSENDIAWVVKTYVDGHNGGQSVMVPYTDFMFRRITTQRPLREKMVLTNDKIEELLKSEKIAKLKPDNLNILKAELIRQYETETALPYNWVESFVKDVRKQMTKPNVTPAVMKNTLIRIFGVKDPSFDPAVDKKGNIIYDKDLKDTEDVPFGIDIDEYMKKNVLPYAPDTIVDESITDVGNLSDGKVGIVGTNINFNKYFYHYEMPRKPEEIKKEIETAAKDIAKELTDIFDTEAI